MLRRPFAKRHASRAPSAAGDVHRHSAGERHPGRAGPDACDELHVDRRIAAVAATQQNLLSIGQLRALGVSRGAWERRIRSGRLHVMHRGVFAVGSPALPPLGRERAALLAVPGAVLSHGSAAAVLGMLPAHPAGDVELTSPTQRRSRRGIRVHRTIELPPGDVRTHRALLVTSPVRTVLDLAPRMGVSALERIVAEVLMREPADVEELRRRGTGRLGAILDGGVRRTRSRPERRLVALVREARLPLPETNVFVAGHEVDAVWPDHRLVVEVDTYGTHGDRVAFERDRRRDQALRAAGFDTVRVTDRQLDDEPHAVTAILAQALATAPERGSRRRVHAASDPSEGRRRVDRLSGL